jgi:hypothetical protein
VSGLEKCPGDHPERSEGSLAGPSQILRCAQDDSHYLHMSTIDFLDVTIEDLIKLLRKDHGKSL